MIKSRLRELVPELRVFLDVDDLEDISMLEAEIHASSAIALFISRYYFSSRACLREVSHLFMFNSDV